MTEYVFSLKYHLPPEVQDMALLLERLGEAGCDDALAGIGVTGRLALEFSREAVSAEEAVRSAMSDVARAVPGAVLIEVSPDLVGLTDVADIVGVSRQAMRKMMLAHATDFPVPVHEGSVTLWHLADILSWLQGRPTCQVNDDMRQLACVAQQVNLEKAWERIAPLASMQPEHKGRDAVCLAER